MKKLINIILTAALLMNAGPFAYAQKAAPSPEHAKRVEQSQQVNELLKSTIKEQKELVKKLKAEVDKAEKTDEFKKIAKADLKADSDRYHKKLLARINGTLFTGGGIVLTYLYIDYIIFTSNSVYVSADALFLGAAGVTTAAFLASGIYLLSLEGCSSGPASYINRSGRSTAELLADLEKNPALFGMGNINDHINDVSRKGIAGHILFNVIEDYPWVFDYLKDYNSTLKALNRYPYMDMSGVDKKFEALDNKEQTIPKYFSLAAEWAREYEATQNELIAERAEQLRLEREQAHSEGRRYHNQFTNKVKSGEEYNSFKQKHDMSLM